MKYRFKQYIPNFCIDIEPVIFDFNSTQELLDNPFICKNITPGFFRFSKNTWEGSIGKGEITYIMVEYDNGYIWWVVGFVYGGNDLDLPECEYKKKPS
ncbi:MAG TPA: hypothetical protein VNW06_01235 [Cytophagaceae bacterium]|jgi:hypothetical protein|nr:hypothetical protein [Cytophagaceae bacterium]